MNKFEKYEFLTQEVTKTGRLLNIVNWGVYQSGFEEDNKDTNKEVTNNQQSTNKELTKSQQTGNKEVTRSNYSDDYIKEKLGIEDDLLFQLKRYIELNNVANLDAEMFNDEGSGSSILELLSNPDEVMDYALDNFDKEDIYKLVFETAKLTEREKRVIYLRFYQNQSLQQVGKEFGVTRERIRQIQERALEKLRKGSTGKILAEYIKNN